MSSGLQREVQVQFCGCEADFLRLLCFNLWVQHPKNPSFVFWEQEDKRSTDSASEDEPNLLSLPKRDTVDVDECGSDSEDNDDLYEDQDSAFFRL